MVAIGTLIWVSLRPLLRLCICVACGFGITKAELFSAQAARGTGQLTLNITIPSLLFSKMVPAFTPENVSALGPLIIIAIIYTVLGIVFAWIIKQFFWVPHRFRYGFLMAGGWANYGDIPTSVVMSLTAAAPFGQPGQQDLAVAYIAAFILIFSLTLFPFGGYKLVAWDYEGPDVEDEERREMVRQKRRAVAKVFSQPSNLLKRRNTYQDSDSGNSIDVEKMPATKTRDEESADRSNIDVHDPDPDFEISEIPIHDSGVTSTAASITHVEGTLLPTTTHNPALSFTDSKHHHSRSEKSIDDIDIQDHHRSTSLQSHSTIPTKTKTKRTRWQRLFPHIKAFLLSLLSPPSLSILIALPIALITPLKALFVLIPNSPIPNAPDNQPPLAFIQDAASFIGAASVPLGLFNLGSALARLNIPRSQWGSLPMGAIFSLAVAKTVIFPILGVLICQALTNAGFINREDPVLRFVCIFMSVLPTATTQVYITQVYSGTGEAGHVSSFLIPQYILMLIAMIILTAYSIHIIF
ncbi:auxin efflux carrier [Abortiporus biennis]|nr:auxin efflux carrier [Abortiporus biennis]